MFFYLDKVIVNSYTQVETSMFEPRLDVRHNNFNILLVEFGIVDSTMFFFVRK